MRTNKRVTVFLGAGATAPLGYPVTDDILKRIWQAVSANKSAKGQPNWRVKADKRDPKFTPELRGLYRQILPGLGRKRLAGASVIDILSIVDQLIAEGRSSASNYREPQLRRAKHLLSIAINGVLRGSKNRKLVSDFVRWVLTTAKTSERITLVSTNYDVAYELPLYRAFTRRSRHPLKLIDMGTTVRDPVSGLDYHRPRISSLAVFKLHGSLNWLRCEVCGTLYVNDRQRIATLEFWTKATPYNTCHCGGVLRSVLVTPSLVRNIREPHLLSIWNAALEDLRLSHEWIFIGYSLPMEDIAIRALLLRAYHSRKQRALRVRLALWDPSEAQRRQALKNTKSKPSSSVAMPNEISTKQLITANDIRARYSVFFPRAVFDDDINYYPIGIEEIIQTLVKE